MQRNEDPDRTLKTASHSCLALTNSRPFSPVSSLFVLFVPSSTLTHSSCSLPLLPRPPLSRTVHVPCFCFPVLDSLTPRIPPLGFHLAKDLAQGFHLCPAFGLTLWCWSVSSSLSLSPALRRRYPYSRGGSNTLVK